MKKTKLIPFVAALAVLAVSACKKTDNSAINYTRALNAYYAASPACLWPAPIKFPVQADTSDTSKTTGYDALVDQGLLTRTSQEKTKLLILSKQVTNYDISDKGRGAWTADPQEPGFGNFCYGTRTVTSIDSSTPTSDQPGATTTVTFHSTISTPPAWAAAAETQNAFPRVRTNVSGPAVGSAILTNTANGWTVTSDRHPAASPVTNADGSIVQ